MRIIHTGDLHLEAALSSNYTKEQARLRRQEMLRTFERMVQFASENEVGVIILAGDIFDTSYVSKKTATRVYEVMASYPEIDFLFLHGNHDRDTIFPEHPQVPNLKKFRDTWTHFQYGNIDICGVELTEENKTLIYDELYLNPHMRNIVVLHGQEVKYAPADDQEIIMLSKLRQKGIDYLALGHVHEHKFDKLDFHGDYGYCGCLEARGFDECGAKGFVLLDVDETGVKHQFIPFASRNVCCLSVDVTGCVSTLEAEERILAELAEKPVSSSAATVESMLAMGFQNSITQKDIVRVELTGGLEIGSGLDVEYLQQRLSNRYFLFQIKDKTRVMINPEEFKYDKSLKGEFVRMLCSAELPRADRDKILMTGIQALTGEEV